MFGTQDWLSRNFLYNEGDQTTGDPAPAPSGDGNANSPSPTPTSAVNDGKDDEPIITMSPSKLEERLQRERDKHAKEVTAQLLASLGVDDLDTAKSVIEAKRQADEAAKTEAEKLQEALDTERQKAQDAENRLAELERARLVDKRDSAIKAAARNAGAVDADDVLLNIQANADTLAGLVDDDGNIQTDAISTAIETLRGAKAHLFGKQVPNTPSNRSGTPPQPSNDAVKSVKKEIESKYKKW